MDHHEQDQGVAFSDVQMEQLRRLIASAVAPVNVQLAAGEKRMNVLASDIRNMTQKQDVNNVRTEEMYESFDVAKKGLAFMGSLGSALKWLAGVVAAVTAIYVALKRL